ncbi:hypothetical protein [Streptomyces nanshensis]|uniref:hypothetical protein n=1 Tax=Streptomyces nanshensis TaxID=518642 RepID=UPI00114CA484|nr:hypothetical protein [Streptomyces nanshensis]
MAARLTAGLNTHVMTRRWGRGTLFYLLDAEGRPLCDHGEHLDGARKPSREAIWPIPVAKAHANGDSGIVVHLAAVPGTAVRSAGSRTETVEVAADLLVRHYKPALAGPASG